MPGSRRCASVRAISQRGLVRGVSRSVGNGRLRRSDFVVAESPPSPAHGDHRAVAEEPPDRDEKRVAPSNGEMFEARLAAHRRAVDNSSTALDEDSQHGTLTWA